MDNGFSAADLATCFAAAHEDHLRFANGWGKWIVRDGNTWAIDNTLQVLEWVRIACLIAADDMHDDRLASENTVAIVLRLARSDPRLAAKPRLRRDVHPTRRVRSAPR